jgi:hypothetical protein
VENLNSRIKVWKALKFWDLDRHDLEFFTSCLGSVCGLLNLEIAHGHPIRVNLRTLRTGVSLPRLRASRKRKREEHEAESVEEEDEGEDEGDGDEGEDEAGEGDVADEGDEVTGGEQEWHQIEGIVGRRMDRDYGLMYLVKYIDGSRIWVTPEHITPDAVQAYDNSHPRKSGPN